MSNAQNMSLEERLVQHIKDTGLGVLITDEDAITELTRRAVREALLQPTRVNVGYGRFEDKDSPVVAAAREIAQKAIERLVDEEVERIKADPASLEAIRQAIALYLPQAIENRARMITDSTGMQAGMQAIQLLKNQGLIR